MGYAHPSKRPFEKKTENKILSKNSISFPVFLFTRDLERIRTSNPQSRNLIFYPVELRGHKFPVKIGIFYVLSYDNLAFTILEIVFPSACPANALETIPITLPMSFIPSAPISSMVITTTFSISSSVNASGKN